MRERGRRTGGRPTETYRTSAQSETGELRSVHTPLSLEERTTQAVPTIIFGVIVSLAMVVFGGGLKGALFGVPIVVVGLCLWGFGRAMAWWLRDDRLELHAGGIVLFHRGEARAITWDAISSVVSRRSRERLGRGNRGGAALALSPLAAFGGVQEGEKAAHWTHEIRVEHGPPMVLAERWTDFGDVVETLHKQRRKRHLPRCRERHASGTSVGFGAFVVAPDGIHHRGLVLRWEDFVSAEHVQGLVVIKRKPNGRFAAVDVRHVPDVWVLLPFLEWAKKQHVE